MFKKKYKHTDFVKELRSNVESQVKCFSKKANRLILAMLDVHELSSKYTYKMCFMHRVLDAIDDIESILIKDKDVLEKRKNQIKKFKDCLGLEHFGELDILIEKFFAYLNFLSEEGYVQHIEDCIKNSIEDFPDDFFILSLTKDGNGFDVELIKKNKDGS